MKKRYRLSLDFESEVKDFTDVPVLRGEWPEDTTPQYIIERLKCGRELLAKMREHPEVLDAYLLYRILADLAADGISAEELAGRMEMEVGEYAILQPLFEELDAATIIHFIDADWNEDAYSATVPLYDAFKEKMVGVSLEEVETEE